MTITATQAKKHLRTYASPAKATILARFFKTGPGQYGAGDIFIGVKVPETRATAKAFENLSIKETLLLLHSPVHEDRLLALLIFIRQYESGDDNTKKSIITTYLKNTCYINNWDLVDLSAPNIIGKWLKAKDRMLLRTMASSKNMWERRIAIVATYTFIKHQQLTDTFHIADMLLHDKEDLIHKAAGWMLREAGKRDMHALKSFLTPRLGAMPRTMLRYAIERFPERDRLKFLKK